MTPSEQRRSTFVDDKPVSWITGGSETPDEPTVLLLHGGGMDHAMLSWHKLVEPLSHVRQWVAPDLPGYGGSEMGDFTQDIDGFGRWLIRFLDQQKIEKADVCGVSMGGGIALWLALNHPQRVRKLLLVDPYGVAKSVMMQRLGAIFSALPLTRWTGRVMGRSRWVTRKTLEAVFYDTSRLTDDIIDMAQAAARDTTGFAAFNRFQREEVLWRGLKTHFGAHMARIDHDTLCIHGRHDTLVPLSSVEPAIASIPKARLEILETGHWPMLEAPDDFNAKALGFLI